LRNPRRFSSHPDLRNAEAAVGVEMVNKYFCLVPLPIEKGQVLVKPNRATIAGPPTAAVEELQTIPVTKDEAEETPRPPAQRPKPKKRIHVDFGPGRLGAIASLATRLSDDEDEEDKDVLKSVSVSTVDFPESSKTVLSAIRTVANTDINIELIEPKPIIVEHAKPKHAELIILPHDQDERAVIGEVDTEDSLFMEKVEQDVIDTSRHNKHEDFGYRQVVQQHTYSSSHPENACSGETSYLKCEKSKHDPARDSCVDRCLEQPFFWVACYVLAILYQFFGMSLVMIFSIMVGFLSLLSAVRSD
jgi:hypothetical protein